MTGDQTSTPPAFLFFASAAPIATKRPLLSFCRHSSSLVAATFPTASCNFAKAVMPVAGCKSSAGKADLKASPGKRAPFANRKSVSTEQDWPSSAMPSCKCERKLPTSSCHKRANETSLLRVSDSNCRWLSKACLCTSESTFAKPVCAVVARAASKGGSSSDATAASCKPCFAPSSLDSTSSTTFCKPSSRTDQYCFNWPPTNVLTHCLKAWSTFLMRCELACCQDSWPFARTAAN